MSAVRSDAGAGRALAAADGSGPPAPVTTPLGFLDWALVGGAVLVGLILRFVTRSPLWLDEALSVNVAALGVGDIPAALRGDGHPPLYYFLLSGWMDLFGREDVAVRALSGVMAVATLPVAFLSGRRIGGVRVGALTVAVVAVSPFALRYATEARMYAMVMLLVFAGHLAVDGARRAPTPVRLGAVAALSGALLLTHYWGLWLVGAVTALSVAAWWRSGRSSGSDLRVAVAAAAGGIALLPWLPAFWFQAQHTGTPWAGVARPGVVGAETLKALGGGQFSEAWLYAAAFVALAALGAFARPDGATAVLGPGIAPPARPLVAVTTVTIALALGASYAAGTTFAGRYAAVFFPFLALLVASGLGALPARALTGTLAVILALSLAGAAWNVRTDRTQVDDISAAIAAEARPGDVVVYCPDQLGPAYQRAIDRRHVDVRGVAYPGLGSPERIDWVDYAERHAATDPADVAARLLDLSEGRTLFVVWSGTYLAVGGQCGDLIGHLVAARGAGRTIVDADAEVFENANLFVVPA